MNTFHAWDESGLKIETGQRPITGKTFVKTPINSQVNTTTNISKYYQHGTKWQNFAAGTCLWRHGETTLSVTL